jgi:hypothetical protein
LKNNNAYAEAYALCSLYLS